MAKTSSDGDKFVFEHSATAFSNSNAYALARMAELAYQKSTDILQQTTAWGFNPKQFVFFNGQKTDTQGFAVANGQTAIFAFRGTETANGINDALIDAKIKFISGPFGGMIHVGFSEGLNEVWPDVLDAIKDLNNGQRTIWFTGHSLGAALATLTAARMTEMKRRLDGMYVFGSPRCGNANFVKGFNDTCQNFHRFVYEQDVVTRVVPRLLGYRHVGELDQMSKDGTIKHLGKTETSTLQEAFIALDALRRLNLSSLSDHKMLSGYVPKLKQNALSGA